MSLQTTCKRAARTPASRTPGFTLIELLTVVAIISLLIGLLVPGVSKAREQAKKAKTRTTIKGIGDGLELFRVRNEDEFHGYPPSAVAEDETEPGQQSLYGAQWVVRCLMGKDMRGYVPRRAVPPHEYGTTPGFQREGWYEQGYERVGPYVEAAGVKVLRPSKLPYAPADPPAPADARTLEQPVFIDDFGYPILYYRADPRQAQQTTAALARYDQASDYAGVYTFDDNALFTGKGEGTSGSCDPPPWDFAGTGEESSHWIRHFGTNPPDPLTITDFKRTFQYYILDRNAYEATVDESDTLRTVIPYRRDSFLLISPGKDGLYGSNDDVNNF